MTEVEQMWAAMNAKFGTNRPWSSLHLMEQHNIVQAINTILIIIHKVDDNG